MSRSAPWMVSVSAPVLAVLSFASASEGAMLVDWGGDYVGTDQFSPRGRSGAMTPFDTDDDVSDGVRKAYPFSLANELNPAIGDDYAGPSARFFGGHADAELGGPQWFGVEQSLAVRDGGDADWIEPHATTNENWNHFLASYLVWKKEDFLGESAAGTVGFGAGGERIDRIALLTREVEAGGYHGLRWFVQLAGGEMYASDDVTGPDNLAAGTLYETTDFAALGWGPLAVTEGSFDRMYLSGGTFAASSDALADVTAVGFVVQGYGSSGKNADRDLRYYQVSGFDVSAAPEPATLALAALGGTCLALRRRRR